MVPLKGYVKVPDCFQEMKEYNVWYEDISQGCRFCGEEDHSFENSPLRNSSPWVSKIVVEKNSKKSTGMNSNAAMEGDASPDEDDKGWKKVADTKGKKPMVMRKSNKTASAMPTPRPGGIIILEPAAESGHYNPMVSPAEKIKENKVTKEKGFANGEEAKGKMPMEPLQEDEESDTNEAMNGAPLLEPNLIHNDHNEQHELVQGMSWNGEYNQFPFHQTELTGMDNIYANVFDDIGWDQCLGGRGGYLLYDVVCEFLPPPKPSFFVIDVDDDEDPIGNSVYKSMNSGGLVVQKINAMEVKKDDMSISDSSKRKNSDYEEDTASSSMKRSRNAA